MEIYNNKFEVTFTNKAAAESAKRIAADTFNAMTTESYINNAYKQFAESLNVEDNTLVNIEMTLLSSEIMEASIEVIKAIAETLKTECFTFDVVGYDEYTESWVEGSFENGQLEITSTYFPCGYTEFLHCPECGEDVVRIEDYDPSKTYVCPECGEEIDLSKVYAENAPVITKETTEIK